MLPFMKKNYKYIRYNFIFIFVSYMQEGLDLAQNTTAFLIYCIPLISLYLVTIFE